MHQRQVIREAIQTALLGNTAALANVYKNRQNPFRIRKLPAIDIVSIGDDIADEEMAPRELKSSYSVGVRAWIAVVDDVDDVMDAIALEIEAVMHADPYFGGAAADSILTGTSFDFAPEGDLDAGTITLAYNFTYYTCAPDAPVLADDFTTAGAVYNLGNDVHVDDAANDSITVQVP